MKLHFHPVSTTSRTVLLFCAEAKIPYETRRRRSDDRRAPQGAVHLHEPERAGAGLEDGDFVLTESSAILKYLAEKFESPAYPKDLKKRARINEVHGLVQREPLPRVGLSPHLSADLPASHAHARGRADRDRPVGQGQVRAVARSVLDKNVIGSHKFVCGDEITIADYFGAELLAAGDLIGVSFKRFPNVDRWMATMRALPSWKKVNEATRRLRGVAQGQAVRHDQLSERVPRDRSPSCSRGVRRASPRCRGSSSKASRGRSWTCSARSIAMRSASRSGGSPRAIASRSSSAIARRRSSRGSPRIAWARSPRC